MNAYDAALITTIRALEALERGPQVRHYPPHPAVDYHAEALRQELQRNGELRELMDAREQPVEPRSNEQYFLEEQCPSDRHFGR